MENRDISMKSIAFKRIIELIDQLKHENNAAYRLMVLTHSGMFIGDIEPLASEKDIIKYTDDPSMFELDTSAFFARIDEECKKEYGDYINNYSINLRDVTVYKLGSDTELMHIEQLILFTEQIIGMTLVKNESK